MKAIELKNLSFEFSKKRIIENLNFTLDEGEKIFVRGDVGSGKTTLFRILTGLIPVFYKGSLEGDVAIFDERDPRKFRDHVHLVSQIPEEQIVFEDVLDEILSTSQNQSLETIIQNAKEINAEHLLERKTSQLSDGEKQLVVILAALSSQKKCLILDEPFSHLHPSRVGKLLEFLLNSEQSMIFSDKRYEHFLERFDGVFDLGKKRFTGDNLTGDNLTDDNQVFKDSIESISRGLTEPSKEILIAENIHFSYLESAGSEEELLNGVDITVRKGEIVSVIGDNGSGKTTLLKILCGILKPEIGKIYWHEKKVSISFQYSYYSFTARSVKDELSISGDLIDFFGLGNLMERHPHTLSAGEAKLVSILKVFSGDLIFLDEPTVYLNPDFCFKLVECLRKEGKTAIIATHDMKLASLCDTIYELKKGKLKEIKVDGEDNK
jgi:energy-coupling factor transport system ATP-binding protein